MGLGYFRDIDYHHRLRNGLFQREHAHRPVLPPQGEHGESRGMAGAYQKLRKAAYPRTAWLLPPTAGIDGIAEIAHAIGKVLQKSIGTGATHGPQRGTGKA